jgi:hypothetical protein
MPAKAFCGILQQMSGFYGTMLFHFEKETF